MSKKKEGVPRSAPQYRGKGVHPLEYISAKNYLLSTVASIGASSLTKLGSCPVSAL